MVDEKHDFWGPDCLRNPTVEISLISQDSVPERGMKVNYYFFAKIKIHSRVQSDRDSLTPPGAYSEG